MIRSIVWAVGLLWAAQAGAAPDTLQVRQTGPFAITYHARHRALVDELVPLLEKKYAEWAAAWARPTVRPVRVWLADAPEEFTTMTRHAIPDWGAGCAFPDQALICLMARGRPWGEAPLDEAAQHELAHVLLHQTAGGQPVPRWFDEGLAMCLAGEWEWTQSFAMVRAVLTRSLVPLAVIDGVLGFGASRAGLAYAESQAAFQWLQSQLGAAGVQQLIRDIPIIGFAAALTQRTGLEPAAFDQAVLAAFSQRYRWYWLLNDSTVFWIGMVMLFLLAYLANRWRTRRIVKRWHQEETVFHVQ